MCQNQGALLQSEGSKLVLSLNAEKLNRPALLFEPHRLACLSGLTGSRAVWIFHMSDEMITEPFIFLHLLKTLLWYGRQYGRSLLRRMSGVQKKKKKNSTLEAGQSSLGSLRMVYIRHYDAVRGYVTGCGWKMIKVPIRLMARSRSLLMKSKEL